jgi:hypothetical protein
MVTYIATPLGLAQINKNTFPDTNICEKLKHHCVTLIPLSSSVTFVGSTIASISNENLLGRGKQSQIFSIFPRQRKFDKVKYIRLMYLQQLLPKV